MAKAITEVLPRNLLEHWAVQAWNRLGTEHTEPKAIQILKRRAKSAVYRLEGLNSQRSAVIAKRCYTHTAEVEQLIYEQLLPRLAVPALRCYGFTNEVAGGYSWLFLEEAVGPECSSFSEPHRVLAGKWLGALHRAARDLGRLPGLPDRDCSYYRDELHFVAAQIQTLLTNPVVPAEDLAVLRTVASQCEVLDGHWPDLQDRCVGIPYTIVHGDFVSKNARVRSSAASAALLVFDWEVAGWGVPATDLAQFLGRTVSPDLDAYCLAMAECGLPRELRALERLAECGRFFRLVDTMRWACEWVVDDSYVYLKKPISFLRSYATRLAKLLASLGWSGDL